MEGTKPGPRRACKGASARRDALRKRAECEVGALVLRQRTRRACAMTARDETRMVALQGRSSKDTKVSDIMTSTVFVVTPQPRTRDCMALMREKRIRHLPVVENGTVLGMLSTRDLLDDLIHDHEMAIAQLERYIDS